MKILDTNTEGGITISYLVEGGRQYEAALTYLAFLRCAESAGLVSVGKMSVSPHSPDKFNPIFLIEHFHDWKCPFTGEIKAAVATPPVDYLAEKILAEISDNDIARVIVEASKDPEYQKAIYLMRFSDGTAARRSASK